MKAKFIRKKLTSLLTVALMTVMLLPGIKPEAATKEYTVTFRPGNVGIFILDAEKLDGLYSNYSITSRGAIKVTVPYGAEMPAAYPYIVTKEGYFVKPWGPEEGAKVERNVDYVADYGKLVDGVEYTVKYVDAETKESVAPAYTTYANIGDSINVKAPASIKNAANGVYELQGAASQNLSLAKDASKNVVVLIYRFAMNKYEKGMCKEIIAKIVRKR